jgi:hypothetical protein
VSHSSASYIVTLQYFFMACRGDLMRRSVRLKPYGEETSSRVQGRRASAAGGPIS